jgi:hypothetical protein
LLLAVATDLVAGVVAVTGAQAYWLSVPIAVAAAALSPPGSLGGAGGARRGARRRASPARFGARCAPARRPGHRRAAPQPSVARFVRERLEAGHEALAALARRDPLTGLANRRALDDRLATRCSAMPATDAGSRC